ncbi:hypothetical protein HTV80_13085 [Streptomyces sp. Vc74B-19]|uniref:hypothetical protein n=1 Tax=Streptomyces sp. Vc74B-19 TaxID=2741324 RepID=UPI001BFC8591|nr:hypothetical protein [Streptomyces sp. Vc74B-19]MBT3164045.1 hypothetical protein [Streptomyces sp. Vc74B-19]
MIEVMLAAALGVAVAGIVLIYRGHRRNRDEINRLRAEVTAAKIAATLQQAAAPPAAEEPAPPQEPVRRKRHLMLYLGGLVVLVSWLGERVRNVWKNHRTATTAVALAATAATAAAAGYQVSAGGGSGPQAAPKPPAAVATQEARPGGVGDEPAPSSTPGPEDTLDPALSPMDDYADTSPESTQAEPQGEEPVNGRNLAGTRHPADGGDPPTRPGGAPPGDAIPGDSTPDEPSTTPPAEPEVEPTQPDPVTSPPPADPSPTPTPTGGTPGKDCTIHVALPPLLDLCL